MKKLGSKNKGEKALELLRKLFQKSF